MLGGWEDRGEQSVEMEGSGEVTEEEEALSSGEQGVRRGSERSSGEHRVSKGTEAGSRRPYAERPG